MTVPARAGAASMTAHADVLPYATPLGPDATQVIRDALLAEVSPRAFRLLAALLVTTEPGAWLSTTDMAAAAGITEHQARPLSAELVAAGFLAKKRKVVARENGVAVVRHRYYLPAGGGR